MKTTPNVTPANNADAIQNETVSSGKFSITPTEPVALSTLIAQAKQKQNVSETVQEPTTYATPEPKAEQPTPAPAPKQEPAAKVEQPAPKAEPAAPVVVPPVAATPTRSRGEEIAYQINKSEKMQMLNRQLQSLKGKAAELSKFSYGVEQDTDHRYGNLLIHDDKNTEFNCQNHGVAALTVEFLKDLFGKKIEEKENELLAVSLS